ncbi:hypothetical protein ACLI4Z_05455 [Natrialbaceae archaeon A-arb3/5]
MTDTQTYVSDSKRAAWYDNVITGYVVAASTITIGLALLMGLGVI